MTNRRPAPTGNRRAAVASRLLSAVALACALSSCATYAERTAFARSSVTDGAYDDAVEAFNDALKVNDRDELPKDHGSKTSLILLERGMVSQAQENFPASARDLGDPGPKRQFVWSRCGYAASGLAQRSSIGT